MRSMRLLYIPVSVNTHCIQVRLTVGRGRNNSRKIVRVQRILKHGSADGDGHSYGSNGSFDYISVWNLSQYLNLVFILF